MRSIVHRVAATAGAVALLATGCSDGSGTKPAATPPTAPKPAVSPSPAVDKTAEQVQSELQAAAAGIGTAAFTISPNSPNGDRSVKGLSCFVSGAVLTPHVPGRAELVRYTENLRKQQWTLRNPVEPDLAVLESGSWDINLGAGPAPEELKGRLGANKGGIAVEASGKCGPLPQ
ncbi:hypothetical protein [Streptomyces tsukubensis]|uniref:hypothetical protein n=1 Tax=Streptomyces tsukubensis TaxID=83656 RepID=UPI00344E9201